MKRYLLATVAALVLPASAIAADMSYPVKAPPAVILPPPFSWTGFYVGVNAGYGGGKFDHPFSGYYTESTDALAFDPDFPDQAVFFGGSADVTSSGFFGGGQIGYNYQFSNNFVLGVEADIQWSGIEGEASLAVADEFGNFLGLSAKTEVEWFGTVRARAGYAWDTLLLYATGGLAYGKVTSSASIVGGDAFEGEGFGYSSSETNWGWTVGAGLEYAINNNWTFKTEYLYVDLGDHTIAYYDDGLTGFTLRSETQFHTVKAGLNYKF